VNNLANARALRSKWPDIASRGPLEPSDVAQSRKHARVLVVQEVAMKRPPSWIVGIESHDHGGFRRHQHGVPHGAPKTNAVNRDNLEGMPMQMHGMRHHGLICEHKLHSFALGDHEGWDILVPNHIVDRPLVALHCSGQIYDMRPVGLADRHGLDGFQ
jgi:hypothetical protein